MNCYYVTCYLNPANISDSVVFQETFIKTIKNHYDSMYLSGTDSTTLWKLYSHCSDAKILHRNIKASFNNELDRTEGLQKYFQENNLFTGIDAMRGDFLFIVKLNETHAEDEDSLFFDHAHLYQEKDMEFNKRFKLKK